MSVGSSSSSSIRQEAEPVAANASGSGEKAAEEPAAKEGGITVLAEMVIREMLQKYDRSGDGTLNLREFQNSMERAMALRQDFTGFDKKALNLEDKKDLDEEGLGSCSRAWTSPETTRSIAKRSSAA